MPKEFWNGDRLIQLSQLTQKKTTTEIAQHFDQPKKVIKELCKKYGFPLKNKKS